MIIPLSSGIPVGEDGGGVEGGGEVGGGGTAETISIPAQMAQHASKMIKKFIFIKQILRLRFMFPSFGTKLSNDF